MKGLFWNPGEVGAGANPYLCPYDEERMAEEFYNQMDSPQSTEVMMERFHVVAQMRQTWAVNALRIKFRRELIREFDIDVPPPQESYIASFVQKYKERGFQLLFMDEIEVQRVINACPKVLRPWYRQLLLLKQSYRDNCICVADKWELIFQVANVNT